MAKFFFRALLRLNAQTRIGFAHATRHQTLPLLFGRAPGNNQSIELLVDARFYQEGGLNKRRVRRAAFLQLLKLPEYHLFNAWMNYGIKAREFGAVRKNSRSKPGPIDLPVFICD